MRITTELDMFSTPVVIRVIRSQETPDMDDQIEIRYNHCQVDAPYKIQYTYRDHASVKNTTAFMTFALLNKYLQSLMYTLQVDDDPFEMIQVDYPLQPSIQFTVERAHMIVESVTLQCQIWEQTKPVGPVSPVAPASVPAAPASVSAAPASVPVAPASVSAASASVAQTETDPSTNNNHAIRWASRFGKTNVVKALLADPRVDPSADNNFAIRWASFYGHTDVVKVLLADPRVDPSAKDNAALRWANQNGQTDVLNVLFADPRVNEFHAIAAGASTAPSHAFMPGDIVAHKHAPTVHCEVVTTPYYTSNQKRGLCVSVEHRGLFSVRYSCKDVVLVSRAPASVEPFMWLQLGAKVQCVNDTDSIGTIVVRCAANYVKVHWDAGSKQGSTTKYFKKQFKMLQSYVDPVASASVPVGPVASASVPVASASVPVASASVPVASASVPVASASVPVGPVASASVPVGPASVPVGPVASASVPVGPASVPVASASVPVAPATLLQPGIKIEWLPKMRCGTKVQRVDDVSWNGIIVQRFGSSKKFSSVKVHWDTGPRAGSVLEYSGDEIVKLLRPYAVPVSSASVPVGPVSSASVSVGPVSSASVSVGPVASASGPVAAVPTKKPQVPVLVVDTDEEEEEEDDEDYASDSTYVPPQPQRSKGRR